MYLLVVDIKDCEWSLLEYVDPDKVSLILTLIYEDFRTKFWWWLATGSRTCLSYLRLLGWIHRLFTVDVHVNNRARCISRQTQTHYPPSYWTQIATGLINGMYCVRMGLDLYVVDEMYILDFTTIYYKTLAHLFIDIMKANQNKSGHSLVTAQE